jgi:hypothetical protein
MTREMKQQEKKEKLFAEWNEKVFEPIQRQIDEKLEQTDFEVLDSQRRELFEEFLEQVLNRKCLNASMFSVSIMFGLTILRHRFLFAMYVCI